MSKRLGSPYRSGRADCWLKVKNPAALLAAQQRLQGALTGFDRLATQILALAHAIISTARENA